MEQYLPDVKDVMAIHLHDGADTWYLDASVVVNGYEEYSKENLKASTLCGPLLLMA